MARGERAAAPSLELDVDGIAASARRAGGVLRVDDAPWLGTIADRDLRKILPRLLPAATSFASAPISGYKVGAIAVCGTESARRLYFGANLEIARAGLSSAVHAEQSAIVNAWMHDEPGVSHLAVSSPPCGYCRQFLYELVAADALELLWPVDGEHVTTKSLRELLPEAFGPATLGNSARLLGAANPSPLAVREPRADPLAERALDAARKSYAPYTRSRAGCAFETSAKRVFVGRYLENAAYNPSLSALQTALVTMNLAPKRKGETIVRAVLVEQPSSVTQLPITQYLLRVLAPDVAVECVDAAEAAREA